MNKTGKGCFQEGHTINEKHGGETAVTAIREGRRLTGIAAQEERQVLADLDQAGRSALVIENAVRLQTACRLYWSAVEKAAQDGNLRQLDSYMKRFGWLAGAALRAWGQVRKEGGSDNDVLDYEKLVESRVKGSEQENS